MFFFGMFIDFALPMFGDDWYRSIPISTPGWFWIDSRQIIPGKPDRWNCQHGVVSDSSNTQGERVMHMLHMTCHMDPDGPLPDSSCSGRSSLWSDKYTHSWSRQFHQKSINCCLNFPSPSYLVPFNLWNCQFERSGFPLTFPLHPSPPFVPRSNGSLEDASLASAA